MIFTNIFTYVIYVKIQPPFLTFNKTIAKYLRSNKESVYRNSPGLYKNLTYIPDEK